MSTGLFSRNDVRKRNKLKHKEAGLCVDCSKKAVKGKNLCEYHKKKYSKRRKIIQDSHKKEGLCIVCFRTSIKGEVRCVIHKEINRINCAKFYNKKRKKRTQIVQITNNKGGKNNGSTRTN